MIETSQIVHEFELYCQWILNHDYMSMTDWLEAKTVYESYIK